MEGQHHRRPVSDGMSEPGNKRQRIHVAEDIRPHHSPYNALNRVVRLNVGGHKYMTTTATLIKVKGSRFEAMFAPGASSPLRDDEGTYFIDRDGTLFPFVLNFLRDGSVELPAEGPLLRALLREAQHYQLPCLISQIQLALGSSLPAAAVAPSHVRMASPSPLHNHHPAAHSPSLARGASPSLPPPAAASASSPIARSPITPSATMPNLDSVAEHELSSSSRRPRSMTTVQLAAHSVADDSSQHKIVTGIDFDYLGSNLAVSTIDGRIRLYSYASFLKQSSDSAALFTRSRVSTISWNKGIGQLLVHGSYEGNIGLWNTETNQLISNFDEHKGRKVWAVTFASAIHPKDFASASDDNTVRLWSTEEKKSTASISAKGSACCVRFSPDDSLLVFGSSDHHVYVYETRRLATPLCIMRHDKAVPAVSFLSQEEIVSSSVDSSISRWHTRSHQSLPAMRYKGHTNTKKFTGLATIIGESGGYIASGSEDNKVYIWHVDNPEPLTTYKVGQNDKGFVSSVCWRPGSDIILSGNNTGEVHAFQTQN